MSISSLLQSLKEFVFKKDYYNYLEPCEITITYCTIVKTNNNHDNQLIKVTLAN